MDRIQSVLIAGAGAIGLTVADSVLRHDPSCLSVLAQGDRLSRYRERGLWINGRRIDCGFADPGEYTSAGRGGRPFDFIIVASKFHQLNQIIADIQPFVGDETIIMSLLNGISSEEIIGAAYGRERLPLAMIIGNDSQNGAGGVTFSQRGVINFGDAEDRSLERDRLIAGFFTRTGIPFEYHEQHMKRVLWYKFMINVGLNQTSALLRLPYGAFKRGSGNGAGRSIPEARELLESAMREVIVIAAAENISLSEKDIDNWYATVEKLSDSGYTSMAQDVRSGRKTEVELFSLTVMEYGRKHHIPTPVNETLYRALRAIEAAGNA
jgi:2-dehydropantoate 2-reductase